MIRLTCALVLLGLVAAPMSTMAGGQEETRFVLHATPVHTPPQCTTDPADGAQTPYSEYTVNWPLRTSADVFLVVANASADLGIAGISCGIDYDAAPDAGVDVDFWSLCAALEFPNSGENGFWPAAGAGTRITWVYTTDCQRSVVGDDGVHAVAGFFRVYAHDDDVMSVTPNMNLESGPEIAVVDCGVVEYQLPPSALGSVGFGTLSGFNPYHEDTPVRPATWGKIKTQYE